MKFPQVVLLLVLIVAACGSDSRPQDPLVEGLGMINTCESHARSAASLMILEREFPLMQAGIREGGIDSLQTQHRRLYDMFFEVTSIGGGGFDPIVLSPLFVPGETTLAELREESWVLEVADMARTASQIWRDDLSDLSFRHGVQLELECSAIWADTTAWLCKTGDEETKRKACRLQEHMPDRDLDVIAEACAQVPYMLLCDPENAPVWGTQEQLDYKSDLQNSQD